MADGKARLQPRWFIVSFWHVHRLVVRITKGRWGLWPPRPGKWGAFRLTTTGRRSGEPRSVILGYFEDGDAMVSMAMNGWGAPEPAWWLNLQANPEALVDPFGGLRDLELRRLLAVSDRIFSDDPLRMMRAALALKGTILAALTLIMSPGPLVAIGCLVLAGIEIG